MDYFLISIGVVFAILGFIGCILPVLPGPPLSYIALVLAYFTRWGKFDASILIWTAIAMVIVTILDYVLPIWTTKRIGGSKRGIWGATIGLIVGIFFLPPIGIIIGPLIGAFIGEYSGNNDKRKALKSALGSLIGFLLGTGLKFAVSGVITYYFVLYTFVR